MNDNERVELNEWCSALIDGHATDSQLRRLEKLLTCSEEARQFYVRTMAMSASLFDYAGEMQCDAPEPANVIRPPQWRRWLAPLAAAAVVTAVAAIGWLYRGTDSDRPDESSETVARLSGARDANWGGRVPSPGDDLARGQRLELRTGTAEVTFDSGAQLLLEGPVSLELRSEWEAELQHGTVKAHIPAEAVGFRVTNAAVEVVNLGTEFSMTAEKGGAAEVFALKGALEVRPRDAGGKLLQKSVLREKQARRFARAGESDVRDGDRKFQGLARKFTVDRLVRPPNYIRWSFDEGEGEIAGAVSNTVTDSHIRLPQAAAGESAWAEGRWGKALRLDHGLKVTAQLSGVVGRSARTAAFWVQVPGDAPLSEQGSMLGFPMSRSGHLWAEFSWNHLPAEGVFGALRMHTGPSSAVGTTAIRDGKWHHLAAVFGQSGKNPAKLHTKIYVDGRLEPFSAKSGIRRPAEELPAELGGMLWLGGRPGSSDRPNALIDELLIADRALAPQEIRHLMRTNFLMTPEALAAN
jgi:ferric-dicitrate binding protein FerR (iron transport regulator)